MSDCMSGSDVSREDRDFDEGQFSDADDEAVEVRAMRDNKASCKAEMNLECQYPICVGGKPLTHVLADGLA